MTALEPHPPRYHFSPGPAVEVSEIAPIETAGLQLRRPILCHHARVDAISLRIDHSGAQVLLAALEADSISDTELNDLLEVQGVRATVANTTKYLPDHKEDAFHTALRTWIETRREPWGHFSLEFAAEHSAEVRELIEELRAESGLINEVQRPLERYLPATGPLAVTVHSVVCGVSDGFVLDGQAAPAFYMALDRAQGDAQGVKLNMTHELYHTAQQASRARVPGLTDVTGEPLTASPAERLLTTVLDEGTATWVARSMLDGDGPYVAMWRSAYEKNAGSETVNANYARFDQLLAALMDGTMNWDDAYGAGFSGIGPPLYFVGFEMSRAIEEARGPRQIGTYFTSRPTAFFRDFVALVPGVLAPRTEQVLAATDGPL